MRKQLFLLVCLLLLPSKALSQGCVECEADIDGDGSVALSDLTIMKAEYGTSTCCDKYPAPVVKTGQTTSYYIGDDGDLEMGVDLPNPRFTDNGDGTVTDNLTGLMWLKDTNCAYTIGYDPSGSGDGSMSWYQALDFVAGINGGTYAACGAGHSDWRLPNIRELLTLTDLVGFGENMLPSGHPFTNATGYYWSSTTHPNSSDIAYEYDVDSGVHGIYNKGSSGDTVWPLRGGQ